MKNALTLALIAAFFALTMSCVKDKATQPDPLGPICDTIPVSYAQDIRPILDVSCVGSSCHSAQGAPFAGGVNLETYTDVKPYADNGDLICVLKATGCAIMPPVGVTPLTQQQIRLFECWVFNGAPEN